MNTHIPGKKHTVGLLLGLYTPFYLMIQKGAQVAADAHDLTLLVDAPAEFNGALQAPLVEEFISRGVEALIITPCDGQTLIEPLLHAHNAGIPVITVDAFLGDGDYTHGSVTFPLAYIGSDNMQGGRIAGELLIRAIGGQGAVFVQSLQPGVSATDLREEGFKEAIARTRGKVQLIGINYDGGSIPCAREQSLATLQNTPSLTGIFGTGDYSTKGLVQAVKEANKQGSVKIVRFDASEQIIEELHESIVEAAIAQRPYEMGKVAIQYALDALNGKAQGLSKHVDTGFVVIDRKTVDTPEAQEAIYRV